MTSGHVSLAALAIAIAAVPRPAVHAVDLNAAVLPGDIRLSRFQAYVEALRTQAGIPGVAAAIVGDSDVLWDYAAGEQDIAQAIAARTDTPFEVDGITQAVTTALALRCVEEGTLSLDNQVGQFVPNSPEPTATVAQLLSHTSGPPGNLTFSYNLDRLAPMASIIQACTGRPYRRTVGDLIHQLAMINSVPGLDATTLVPPAGDISALEIETHYVAVLARLATPYAVDSNGQATQSQYAATKLTPATGLISSVLDLSNFILALRQGVLLQPDTLGSMWRPPIGANGLPLPHGLGWFVQSYNGATVVWQFGLGLNSSSSLLMMVPSRDLTLILVANCDCLSKPFPLSAGNVLVSPYARLFLGLFVR
jgi:CubicO group peptidase (beta-lactamase class C family)